MAHGLSAKDGVDGADTAQQLVQVPGILQSVQTGRKSTVFVMGATAEGPAGYRWEQSWSQSLVAAEMGKVPPPAR